MTLEHPNTRDGAVVVLAKQTNGSKGVLVEFVQTLEHASDEVTGHEDHGELVIVLVISPPDGVVLMVKVFPEPGHGLGFIIVGVESLPFFKIKGSFGHFLKWISFLLNFGFIFCRFLLFLFFFLLLRLFLGFLFRSLFLLFFLVVSLARELGKLLGIKLCHFGAQIDLANYSLGIGLIDHGIEPSGYIYKRFSKLSIQNLGIETDHGASHGNIRQTESLTNKEGSGEKMIVQSLESSLDVLLGPLGGRLVVLHDAHCGEDPGTGCWQDLVICHAHPLHNLSSSSSITAPTKFIICHIVSNSIGFCQQHSI